MYGFIEMFNFRSITILLLTVFLYSCTSTGGMEDTSTGLYEKGGMSYLDKDGTVPAKIYFDYDSYLLTSMAESTLDMQVTWMDQNPDKFILIEGHCDERGTREYNLALGERRASSVKNYLVSLGIDANRISVISYGKEKPSVSGHNDWAWSQNRTAITIINN